jgi:ankyrin repeat protein
VEDFKHRTPLILAAEFSHDDSAELLLESKAVQQFFEGMDRTALTWSIEHGYPSLVKVLLCKGVDPNQKDGMGLTPLTLATMYGNEHIVSILLNSEKIKPNCRDSCDGRALGYATEIMHTIILREVVAINSLRGEGKAPLWWACRGNYPSIVKLLLDADGVELDASDRDGNTYLFDAVQNNYLGVIRVLCGRIDANYANLVNQEGRTPLWHACSLARPSIVSELLNIEGIDPNLADEHGRTPLSMAAERGSFEVIQMLQPRANANISDREGRSPLWWASKNDRPRAIEALLKFDDIELDARDEHGYTPLSIAVQHRISHVMQILSRRANVNTKDNKGRTPLWWAASLGYLGIIDTLMESPNIDPNSQDGKGRTPLLIAAEKGRMAAIRILAADKRVSRTIRSDEGLSVLDWLQRHDARHVIHWLKQ